jgi:3-hydroxyisobutyrate dehydrogenase-like beta-hydroxyacid dehydrogenase
MWRGKIPVSLIFRNQQMHAVTVIGMGTMGATIAKLLHDNHNKVTVWNRTREKSDSLALKGVVVSDSAASAIAASPLIIMCVYDYKAVKSILDLPGVANAISGKTLVQLTTGSPADVREQADWATAHRVFYLDGTIQAAPSQMGAAETPILISGDQDTFMQWKPLLASLAGNYVNLGAKPEAAATTDLATLSYVYGAFVGFIHGALIAESEGLDIAQFGKLVADISPSFGAFFAHEARVIQSGDFKITESPLRISVEATQRIHDFSHDKGLNTEFSNFTNQLLRRAHAAGLGNEEVAALIKVMRR